MRGALLFVSVVGLALAYQARAGGAESGETRSYKCQFKDVVVLEADFAPDIAKIKCPGQSPVYVSHKLLSSIEKAPHRHWYVKLTFNNLRKVSCIKAEDPQRLGFQASPAEKIAVASATNETSITCKFGELKILENDLRRDFATVACPSGGELVVTKKILQALLGAPNKDWLAEFKINNRRQVLTIKTLGPVGAESL